MAEISEAEKRQRLRERRAAKIKNGASRLGKITGDYSEVPKQTPAPQAPPAATTTSSSSSNRISQSFDDKDPEIEDISKFEPIDEVKDLDPSSDAKQFEQMLEKMLSSPKHQHDGPTTAGIGEGSEFDIFAKLLGTQGADSGIFPPSGQNNNNEDYEYETKLSEYNKILNDQFKAKFMMLRLVIMMGLSIWFYQFKGFHSSSSEILRIKAIDSGFIEIWSSFEILFTGIYAMNLNKIKDSHYNYNSKILNIMGMVPDMILPSYWKDKIRWVVKYQELINLIIFDLSCVIFILGVLSGLHSIQV
ncbi:hypothetical protein WICANDRAFT_79792 [Wickerhamomyces anomalus NRRL Y-366-8]|uniref:Golgi to ER traffic protein 2 n=1 Tax=Wickerhamomyces anomalus (strain ATCC 58044 / CBS 1984 / NCYC 433 / NRRL Y-366-8) TaxID=683960 RepID=A0A1E3P1D9_WICAA|nr:uncharacterized protein WICANDRAFT_79792 [Wickerhamomyces anomalus NRRL Y-366-8]ODQ59271.1 hypothetical protein WICANDRAFT_79792 [Wickerhamomyces anomalus NRRL Y-366-8]